MKKIRFTVGLATDAGMIRKANQDSIMTKICLVDGDEIGCFMVADGMGGLTNGGLASLTVASSVRKWLDDELVSLLKRCEGQDETCVLHLENLLRKINLLIVEYAAERNITMGTTCSILLIIRANFYILHVGDTRIYKITRKKIIQLTNDDTWIERQIKDGKLTKSEAKRSANKHMLTNCLGVLENFTIFKNKGVTRLNDYFLICSDGLYNFVSDEEALKYLSMKLDVQDIADRFIKLARDRGGSDNISAIVIKLIKN